MPQLILTAIGNDRPGLVGELTGFLLHGGANILDTRMVNLRGRFAILILLEAENLSPLTNSLPSACERLGLTLHMSEHGRVPPRNTGLRFRLKTYSLDQPGLVHRITEVLRTHSVNIEDLTARQDSAPFAGDPLFTMEMRLTVPAIVPIRKLRDDIQACCEKLNADMDFEQV